MPLAAIEAELSNAAQFCLSRYAAAREAICQVIGAEDIEDVAVFHERYLPLLSSEIHRRLNGTSVYVNYDWSLSLTLRHNAGLKSVLIAYPDEAENTSFVYGLAVHHRCRRTWPSILMRYYAAHHLARCGYEFVSFQTLHDNTDAIRLARRALKTSRIESLRNRRMFNDGE